MISKHFLLTYVLIKVGQFRKQSPFQRLSGFYKPNYVKSRYYIPLQWVPRDQKSVLTLPNTLYMSFKHFLLTYVLIKVVQFRKQSQFSYFLLNSAQFYLAYLSVNENIERIGGEPCLFLLGFDQESLIPPSNTIFRAIKPFPTSNQLFRQNKGKNVHPCKKTCEKRPKKAPKQAKNEKWQKIQ